MPNTQLSAQSKALHWEALRDLRVASDIAGAGASGEFINGEYSFESAPPEEIYGSALGVPGAKGHSGYGVFTDKNGNTIVIATESREAWGLIWGKSLLGRDPYTFRIPRNMGTGGAFEANAFMMAGVGQRYGGYASWIDMNESQRDGLPGLTLQPYNDFPSLLTQIENTGRKFDRPIVILNSGKPITFASVMEKALTIILAIAKPFAAMIGIPPMAFDILSKSLTIIATQGHFDVSVLADAAQLMLPAEYRSLIPKATAIYANITSGNYLGAMEGLGISGNILGAKDSLLKGDISALLGKSSLGYGDLVGRVQNLFQMDTIRSLSAANRSGSVVTNLIDAGTMTKVPVLQNLLAATTSDTLSAAIPGVSEIFQKAINETNDISNVNLHKAAIQSALGQPVGADAFDELSLRGLKERANEVLEKGAKQFVMPIVIPDMKRYEWAQLIADEVRIPVFADSVGGGTKAQPKAFTDEWR